MYQALYEKASVFHVPIDVEHHSECQAVLVTASVWGGGSKTCVRRLPMTDESLSNLHVCGDGGCTVCVVGGRIQV